MRELGEIDGGLAARQHEILDAIARGELSVEASGPQRVFKDLAWGLASRGVAVLRYDKRTFAHRCCRYATPSSSTRLRRASCPSGSLPPTGRISWPATWITRGKT